MTTFDAILGGVAALSLATNLFQSAQLREVCGALDNARKEVRVLVKRLDSVLPTCGNGRSNADEFLHAQMATLRAGTLDVGNRG